MENKLAKTRAEALLFTADLRGRLTNPTTEKENNKMKTGKNIERAVGQTPSALGVISSKTERAIERVIFLTDKAREKLNTLIGAPTIHEAAPICADAPEPDGSLNVLVEQMDDLGCALISLETEIDRLNQL